jgi:uncharacterized membrane protein
MALPVRQQVTYWGIAAVALLVVLWAMGDVILPFIVGGAVAYFLDPVADRLERMGLGRALATVLIFIVLILVVVLAALIVMPTLIQQATDLVQAPRARRAAADFLTERFPIGDGGGFAPAQLAGVHRRHDPVAGRQSCCRACCPRRRGWSISSSSSSSCRWWPSTCCSTGTAWSRGSTICCRATMRRSSAISRADRPDAGQFRARAGDGLPDPWHVLCRGADGDRVAIRAGRWAGGGASDLHSLRGRAGGRGLSIGLALFQFWGEWWSIIAVAAGVSGRPAGRGQHPDAEAGGQFGGPAPRLADLRAVGLRGAVRLRRDARRGAGGRGDRGSGALCARALSRGALYRGVEAARVTEDPRTGRRPDGGATGFDLPVRPAMGRDDFFVTGSNAARWHRWTAGATGRSASWCWWGRRARARPISPMSGRRKAGRGSSRHAM